MLPFSYEDRYPNAAIGTGYGATNEEPLLMRPMIKPFKAGLGIASAGEVTFLALLPKTQETLVLIDHSYTSLRVFCLKALLLATLGPVETRNLLIAENAKGWQVEIDKVKHHLPSRVENALDRFVMEQSNVRREWFYADLPTLRRAAKNLHKIKLIHGDLFDVTDRGPYDFLYLSNALEHTGRGGTSPQAKDISSKLVKTGSPVIWVQANGAAYGGNKEAQTAWDLKTSVTGYRSTWVYHLSTTRAAQA